VVRNGRQFNWKEIKASYQKLLNTLCKSKQILQNFEYQLDLQRGMEQLVNQMQKEFGKNTNSFE